MRTRELKFNDVAKNVNILLKWREKVKGRGREREVERVGKERDGGGRRKMPIWR